MYIWEDYRLPKKTLSTEYGCFLSMAIEMWGRSLESRVSALRGNFEWLKKPERFACSRL